MIRSFRDKNLERCFSAGRCSKLPADLHERLIRVLDILNAASNLYDVAAFPALGLHPLKGKRQDVYAVTVNGPWRITFKVEQNQFSDVALEQYH